MTSPHDVLFPNDRDPLAQYRREDAERKSAADRERQAGQHQATEARQVTVLRAEIADLRARLDEGDQTIVRLADTIDILIDKTPTWVEKMIEARALTLEAKMVGQISESFGELRGWISAIDPTKTRAAEGGAFRFASEKGFGENDGEPVDLPNPLPPRRAIN